MDRLPETLGDGEAYYQLLGREGNIATFRSTIHAQGTWNPGEQHMGPATGVLVHELARLERPGTRLVRIGLDILGLIPAGEFTVTTRMVRPGRTIELLEAALEAHGRTAIVARAWRLATGDSVEVETAQTRRMPGDEHFVEWDVAGTWPGGYIRSLRGWHDPRCEPGHGRVWLSNPHPMVEGEETPALVKLMGMVDTANGVASLLDPQRWVFPNVDLQIHLFRSPRGERLGLETRQSVGPDGVGLTSSTLHDAAGPFGTAEQILTVRPRPRPESS